MNVRHDMVTVFVARPTEDGESFEFLQLRRAKSDYMGGTWQIIRGGVNADESYLAAALRELREESGLIPNQFFRLGQLESFYVDVDDAQWFSTPFCAIVARNQSVQLNDEHDSWRWIARDQIERETMWSSEQRLLNEAFFQILDDGPAKPYLRIELKQ